MTSTFSETEDQVHLRVVKWLDMVLPHGYLLHHSPNEGKRHINFKTKLKRMGTKSGWPDLEIFVPDESFYPNCRPSPIMIELKRTKGGRISDHQKQLSRHFNHLGIRWYCCNSVRAVRDVLRPLMAIHESVSSDSLLEPITNPTRKRKNESAKKNS